MSARPDGTVEIAVDGAPVEVRPGLSVAAALVGSGRWTFRANPVTGEARGPLCGMGVCMECEVDVDGTPHRRACLERVRAGMSIGTGRPRGNGEGDDGR